MYTHPDADVSGVHALPVVRRQIVQQRTMLSFAESVHLVAVQPGGDLEELVRELETSHKRIETVP